MGNVISFKKGAEFLTYEEGTVYFDESSHTIKVGTGDNQYKEFSGVKTVNGKSSDDSGNVTVKTFSDVPDVMNPYKTKTLEEYCKKFLVEVNPEQGSAYLTSGIAFTNLPKSFFDRSTSPSCELFIYVPMRSGNNVVFNLEITTTNCFEEQWYGGPGKWMAICQVESGIATLHMPWRGVLSCPQTDELIGGKHRYIPVKDSDSVSKYHLDQELLNKADKTEIPSLERYAKESWVEGKGYLTASDISGKVDTLITSTSGKALVFNEVDGGGAKFEDPSGNKSYVGVNNGSVRAQIYALDSTNTGIRLNTTSDGIYYTKGKSDATCETGDELVVKRDLENKLDLLPLVEEPDPGAGWPYHIPYDADISADKDKATITLKTLTLDNKFTKMNFDKELSSATTSAAGLMSADDKSKLDNIRTFTEVPDTYNDHPIRKDKSIKDFCDDVITYMNPKAGSGYLAALHCDDLPKGIGNAELLMYVPVQGIYVLELTTTNAFDSSDNPGKFIAMYHNNRMVMTWKGFMTCPQKTIDNKVRYIPEEDSDGVSKYYLDQWMSKEVITDVNEQSSITISHSFLKSYPNVVCVDSTGNLVQGGTVHYDNNKQITVTFSAPFTGKIIIN